MGGAALAEVVPTGTANRPMINASATLFISAIFLPRTLKLWLSWLLRVAVIAVPVRGRRACPTS